MHEILVNDCLEETATFPGKHLDSLVSDLRSVVNIGVIKQYKLSDSRPANFVFVQENSIEAKCEFCVGLLDILLIFRSLEREIMLQGSCIVQNIIKASG